MHNPKAPGLINALLANRADTPAPAHPLTLSALSRGLLGLDSGPGALSSFHAPQPRQLGALAQLLADSDHDRLLENACSKRVGSPARRNPVLETHLNGALGLMLTGLRPRTRQTGRSERV